MNELEPLFDGGHHGLVLASKSEAQNTQLVDYPDKFLVGHAALYAEIEGVQVACTHHSTRLPIPYGGKHGNEEGQ